jgi:transcriptional regulator with XRE-family HTH domain
MTQATNTSISARKLAIFSANVARQRKASGLSKAAFARNTTVKRDTIRRIETRPEGYIPSASTIEALAALAGVPVQKILTTKLKFQ